MAGTEQATLDVSDNRERGLGVEDEACLRWPLEPVEDERRDHWHDLVFVEDLEGDLAGVIADRDAPVECKSCQHRMSGGRRGRWWIDRDNHERLLESDGWYVLAIVDGDDVVRMALAKAETVDAIIDGSWWDCGNGGQTVEQYRQVPWSDVFIPGARA